MSFFRNVFDYFRGSNTKREDGNNHFPGLEDNNGQNIPEAIPRQEIDIELPPDFIDKTFGGYGSNNDDVPGFYSRNIASLFGDFSSLIQTINNFEQAVNEMERHFSGTMGFHDFAEAKFEDINAMFRGSEKTLTGERLRNYYLNGNSTDTYQGGNQILAPNDKESSDNQTNLIMRNDNRSDFTMTPYFKSQAGYMTIKVEPDGIAEITAILKDETGNEERIVRKVKLF